MTIRRMRQRLEDTQRYFNDVDDREVKCSLNNLADIVTDMIEYLEEHTEDKRMFVEEEL